MRSAMTTLLATLTLVYAGLCATLFVFQRSLIYLPQTGMGGPAAPTLTLPVQGADLRVTFHARQGQKALIYFGGNAEDVSHTLPELSAAFPEHALYLLNYRGFGGSSGRPSEAVLFADGLALFDKVRETHRSIAVMGRSLGSAVAVYVASLRSADHLILVTPFDSLTDVAARHYPFVPVRWLLLDRFESWKFAPLVKAPTLVIAAEHDEVVPRSSTKALADRFQGGTTTLLTIPGAGHNTLSDCPEYMEILKSVH